MLYVYTPEKLKMIDFSLVEGYEVWRLEFCSSRKAKIFRVELMLLWGAYMPYLLIIPLQLPVMWRASDIFSCNVFFLVGHMHRFSDETWRVKYLVIFRCFRVRAPVFSDMLPRLAFSSLTELKWKHLFIGFSKCVNLLEQYIDVYGSVPPSSEDVLIRYAVSNPSHLTHIWPRMSPSFWKLKKCNIFLTVCDGRSWSIYDALSHFSKSFLSDTRNSFLGFLFYTEENYAWTSI